MNKLAEYLSVAFTGTGQKTFYNTKAEQEAALKNVHVEMLVENRRSYRLTGLLPIADRSQQLIVENLLEKSFALNDEELVMEWHTLLCIAEGLPFNRLLNVYMRLVEAKSSKARVRKFGRWIWEKYADPFRVIKYRSKFRRLLRHAHIPMSQMDDKRWLHLFCFNRLRAKNGLIQHRDRGHSWSETGWPEDFPAMLKERLSAPKEYEALFRLPFDIARDIAVAEHGKKADEFAKEFSEKGRLTKKETLRARTQAKSVGQVDVNFDRFNLLDLVRYAHQHPEEWNDLKESVDRKAIKTAENWSLPERVSIVVDNSQSARGSGERLHYPISVIESLARAVQASGADVISKFVTDTGEGPYKTAGSSDLRKPLAEALAELPDLVMILSDGYENVSAGSVSQIMNTKAVRESGIPVVHFNPVTASESGTVRNLADNVPTFSISEPRQLPMLSLMGRVETDPHALDDMFKVMEEKLLEGDYEAARNVARIHGFSAASLG